MDRKVTHDTFRIERQYGASPARVFAAFTTKEAKAQWFHGPDEWQKSAHTLDFKIGGKEQYTAADCPRYGSGKSTAHGDNCGDD